MKSLVIGTGLVVAFLFMASIFAPDRTQAGGDETPEPPLGVYSAGSIDTMGPLGEMEGAEYDVKIFATPTGPLYSVYGKNGDEVGTLLTADEIARRFPELPIDEARADVPLEMMGTDVGRGPADP